MGSYWAIIRYTDGYNGPDSDALGPFDTEQEALAWRNEEERRVGEADPRMEVKKMFIPEHSDLIEDDED